jgi:APA family basic amino acid/polyamine antiporter
MPIGLIGSLAICTIFYLLAAGVIGSVGAQPVMDARHGLEPGSRELAAQCASIGDQAVVCEGSAGVDAARDRPQIGNLIGLAAGLALPSVILMMMFGQTRIFFVMSRDGLLPAAFSKIHPKFNTARDHHPDGCVRGLVLRVLSRSACWRTFRIRARCSLSRRCRSRC